MTKPVPELKIIETVTRVDLTGKPLRLHLTSDGGLYGSLEVWVHAFEVCDHKSAWYISRCEDHANRWTESIVPRGNYRGQILYDVMVCKRALETLYASMTAVGYARPLSQLQRQQEEAFIGIFHQLRSWSEGLLRQDMTRRVRAEADLPATQVPPPQLGSELTQAIKMLASIAVERHEPLLQEHDKRIRVLEDRRRDRDEPVTLWVAALEIAEDPTLPVTKGNAILAQRAGQLLKDKKRQAVGKTEQRQPNSRQVIEVALWRREDAYWALGQIACRDLSGFLKP